MIFHAKHRRAVARRLRPASPAVLVAARGDRSSSLGLADFELVQNRLQAGPRRLFLPHWPQPALVPRDPARGDRLECAAFKGYLENLHPELRGDSFGGSLAELGVDWRLDAVPFARGANDRQALAWPDFFAIDAIVALRAPGAGLHNKPAAKLYNAWHAGVPALLGPEPAYRALRRGPLDYLEVDGPESVRGALRRLRDEPGLFRAMVDNGRDRAPDFSFPTITAAWSTMLLETLPARLGERAIREETPAPGSRLRRAVHRALALAS